MIRRGLRAEVGKGSDRNRIRGRASRWTVLFLVALGGLWLGGCSEKCVDLESSTEKLDRLVGESRKPVLVDFWKFGCASCISLEPLIGQLAEEYDGRVVVGRFMAAHFWFAPTNWEVFKRYGFAFFPTVILFVDGEEKHRWVWDLDAKNYRAVLDPMVPPPPATQPASAPAKDLPAATQPKAPTATTLPAAKTLKDLFVFPLLPAYRAATTLPAAKAPEVPPATSQPNPKGPPSSAGGKSRSPRKQPGRARPPAETTTQPASRP